MERSDGADIQPVARARPLVAKLLPAGPYLDSNRDEQFRAIRGDIAGLDERVAGMETGMGKLER